MDAKFTELVEQLNGLDFKGMYGSDFLHTWDKTTYELKALYIVADALRELGHLVEVFEAPEAAVYLVPTGTAANALALACLCPPWALPISTRSSRCSSTAPPTRAASSCTART